MNQLLYNIAGTDCSISIIEGNILDQEGLKIIHCPRNFDTSSDIVPKHSVFGQFVNLCEREGVDINTQIDSWLSLISDRGTVFPNNGHREVLFDIGELCPIIVNGEHFCIAAFSMTYSVFLADNLELADYMTYWSNLWQNLSTISIAREIISVAVPGDRLVNISTKGFLLPQKIAVIVNSFLQNIKSSGVCKHLNICLYGNDAEYFDYNGWRDSILPFLDQLSHLPISWNVRISNAKPQALNFVESSQPIIDKAAIDKSFFTDLRDMISNLENQLGNSYCQFEGNKKTFIVIDPNIGMLQKVSDWLENDEQSRAFFVRHRGNRYDKNGMFQLIGVIHDVSNYYGSLNRRSVLKLSLNCEDVIPERWNYLGDNIDNIINYVGQKLADIKKNHTNIYNNIRRQIPPEYRRKS